VPVLCELCVRSERARLAAILGSTSEARTTGPPSTKHAARAPALARSEHFAPARARPQPSRGPPRCARRAGARRAPLAHPANARRGGNARLLGVVVQGQGQEDHRVGPARGPQRVEQQAAVRRLRAVRVIDQVAAHHHVPRRRRDHGAGRWVRGGRGRGRGRGGGVVLRRPRGRRPARGGRGGGGGDCGAGRAGARVADGRVWGVGALHEQRGRITVADRRGRHAAGQGRRCRRPTLPRRRAPSPPSPHRSGATSAPPPPPPRARLRRACGSMAGKSVTTTPSAARAASRHRDTAPVPAPSSSTTGRSRPLGQRRGACAAAGGAAASVSGAAAGAAGGSAGPGPGPGTAASRPAQSGGRSASGSDVRNCASTTALGRAA
jgi:hypothetical protein